MTTRPTIGRRRLLQASAGLGVAAASGLAVPGLAGAQDRDYAKRATYDWAEAYFTEHADTQPDVPNENRGALAWGQSYVLRSYNAMYAAFGDQRYLDLLCRNVDAMLTMRDSERGVTDWRGESLPVWRATHPYTAGQVEVPGEDSTTVLRIRTAQPYADDISAQVEHESDDRFTVVVTDPRLDLTDTFTNLTMDPASPDYVVKRIYDASPMGTRVTAVDLTSDGQTAMPRAGTYEMASNYVTFSVHTGMITAPIAQFCRTVAADASLRSRYGAKAEAYLSAVRAAIDCHDHEWRENDEGEGWYIWEKGTPLQFDGCEMPHNQFLALATTQLHMSALTDQPPYRDRALRMLTTFRNDLRIQENSYVWSYWWSKGSVYSGYTQDDGISEWVPAYDGSQGFEDGSHGAVDVEAMVAAHAMDEIFDDTDMQRIAATYTDNLMHYDDNGDAHVWTSVDGTSNLGAQDLQAPRWVNLASWDDRIFTHAREIFNREQPEPVLGSSLLGTAFLAGFNAS